MLQRVFIANRGEIAVRVARACRQLGIASVAAFSEADAGAVHVSAADESVCVGPADPRRSYLDVEAVVAAAVRGGCDALHPGYGFLAEDPALAEACADAGLTFVGPPPEVTRLLGDKVRARRTMRDAGVPVVPGTFEATTDARALEQAAAALGFPLLVKATGGGGGAGLRRVDAAADLRTALEEAGAEAGAAFGNPALYLEALITPVRHVEVQVLADGEGAVVALGERECSLQRRHQKVIEESPSPAVHVDLRERLLDAARRAAEAAGYLGAGTVEFLLGDDDAFSFLEVNARIQVEHPVTEARFGVDLVGWQLRIAGGEALDPALEQAEPRGWAMEARLIAEDPAAGFLPSAGRVAHLRLPSGPGIRVDGAVETGTVVSQHYDPLLAKIIAWGPDRETCRVRLRGALAETEVLGLATNAAFLVRVLDDPSFVDGRTFTDTLETSIAPRVAAPSTARREVALAAAAVALERGLGEAGAPAPTEASGERGVTSRIAVPGPWELLGARRFPGGETP